jgi:hypothetical protein
MVVAVETRKVNVKVQALLSIVIQEPELLLLVNPPIPIPSLLPRPLPEHL